MDVSLDPIVKLALSLGTNKGAYALLLGSGVSVESGIPSGWSVLCDLVSKVAKLYDEDVGLDPIAWFEGKFGEKIGYSSLMSKLAHTQTERQMLIKSYFEPTEKSAQATQKLPNHTHRSIAKLVSDGFIKVIVTTNFDRLIEKSLTDLNINPIVISKPEDIFGSFSLFDLSNPLVLKVNGDYLDPRIKNTPEELAVYDKSISDLLESIFGEFGLLLSGWSGIYDTALVDALRKSRKSKYSTVWIDPFDLNPDALKLLEQRDGTFVKTTANEFFRLLQVKVSPDNLQVSLSKQLLPESLSSFIGRKESIEYIKTNLPKKRLLSIVGPGGIGKTRVAIRALNEMITDSGDNDLQTIYVDLSGCRNKTQVQNATKDALSADAHEGQSVFDVIKENLTKPRNIILFDNCEHVITDVSEIIGELLSEVLNVNILATSREHLNIPGEDVWLLKPLSFPNDFESKTIDDILSYEATQLFVERVSSISKSFSASNENKYLISEICKHLDGIPLAIELAASRANTLSVKEIGGLLSSRFDLLKKTSRKTTVRHHTLRNAIEWSYDLLSEVEKHVFMCLSIFEDGFSLEAAKHVSKSANLDVFDFIDVLDELVKKSLVYTIRQDNGIRYKMFESIQAFGFEKLHQSVVFEVAVKHYIDWYLEKSIDFHKHRNSPDYIDKVNTMRLEFVNWKKAILLSYEQGRYNDGIEISVNNAQVVHFNESQNEFLEILERFVAKEDEISKELLCKAYMSMTRYATVCNNVEKSIFYGNKLLDIYKAQGDLENVTLAIYSLSRCYTWFGEHTKAKEYLEEASEIASRIGNKELLFKINSGLAELLYNTIERIDVATKLLEECMDTVGQGNIDHDSLMITKYLLAKCYIDVAKFNEAQKIIEEYLDYLRKIGYRRNYICALHTMAFCNFFLGKAEEALTQFDEAEDLLNQHSLYDVSFFAEFQKALIHFMMNNQSRCCKSFGKMKELVKNNRVFEKLEKSTRVGYFTVEAFISFSNGCYKESLELCRQVSEISREIGDKVLPIVKILESMSYTLLEEDENAFSIIKECINNMVDNHVFYFYLMVSYDILCVLLYKKGDFEKHDLVSKFVKSYRQMKHISQPQIVREFYSRVGYTRANDFDCSDLEKDVSVDLRSFIGL